MSMKKESPWDVELHLAAARGDAKRLHVLLDSGRVHVDCKDKDGTTPLILAAAGGHIEAVSELLQQGADPKSKRLTGTTSLFFAAQGGFVDIVTLLIEHGATVDSCSIDGGTPLFVACQCGHLDVVEALKERGANVNAHMKDGATALFIAAQNGHVRILEVLLAQGAQTDAARTDGATPLWIAAQMGHDHVVRRLLKAGAKVDATRHDGATPLFKAAHKGHTAVIGELLKYRPSLGILPNGESALHAAALTGHMTVARQLVGAGADPLLVNQEGLTPLQLAVRHSHGQVANYLEDKAGVDAAPPCENRRTDCRFGKSFLQDVCTQKVPSKKVKDALDEAETCRGMLNILKDNITIVKDLHNNALSHTDPGIQAQLESRTFIISQTAFRTRTSLKELGNKIPRVDELTLDSTRDGPAHARIRFLQYTTMTKIFSDIMYEYNESLTRYHEKCSSLLHQQKILLRKETASQIFQSNDDDDDDGEEKQQLFVDNILEESKLARLQLSDIETRHKEVLKIEKSLVEVRDMLTDIAFYIEKQGEQLDYVEVFAGQATDNVEGGRDDLARAEIRRNRNRKRKYKLYIILVVIVALIVVVLAVSL